MPNYLIKVDGNIRVDEGIQYAQEWVCEGMDSMNEVDTEYKFNPDTRSVEGDLVLNNRRRSIPYAIYYSKQGIAIRKGEDICLATGYHAALYYFNEYIENIRNVLDGLEESETVELQYKSLFIDVFSILELFLSDCILCLIYSDERMFDKAKDYLATKKQRSKKYLNDKTVLNSKEIEQRIHRFFSSEVVYHRFDCVSEMYRKIAAITFPDYTELQAFLHKRNNIVHRYSLSGIDRMSVINISKDEVQKLVNVSRKFVDDLVASINATS